uniref:Uncharacterized protein n=1 Tax=Pyxicephalus adspersus TaxID=30357 RepID=A0AAV3AXV5_PYXAD|nr:TPA: hypothetical protein GDO54_008099 [Pyxicephalus adspersus]
MFNVFYLYVDALFFFSRCFKPDPPAILVAHLSTVVVLALVPQWSLQSCQANFRRFPNIIFFFLLDIMVKG